MFGKFGDAFDLFRKGCEVANKGTWKDAGTATPVVSGVLMAAVKLAGDFGWIHVQLTMEEAGTIAAGISAAVLYVVHIVTSSHAGILPAKGELLPAKPVADALQKAPEATESPVQPINQAVDGKASDSTKDTSYIG